VSGFLELSFALGELDPEAAESACFALGATAVTFADAADDPVLEPLPGEVRLWRSTILTALFGGAADAAALAGHLARMLQVPPARIGARHVEDRAWEREWLRDFHAMRFGERLWVCPHHEEVAQAHAVVVRLDPGLAFGTGTHASTALCLGWLDAHLLPGARVIDFGCGSGVLAVAAALLGAAEVHAFDIDPQALTATAENAAANGVASRVRVHALAGTLPATSDVLLANILAGTLCTLAPRFAQATAAGGAAVLAGILEHEVPDVTAAYSPWFDVSRFGGRDGWAALSGRRR
jgi:ribosomal protein L11 methyltransferase